LAGWRLINRNTQTISGCAGGHRISGSARGFGRAGVVVAVSRGTGRRDVRWWLLGAALGCHVNRRSDCDRLGLTIGFFFLADRWSLNFSAGDDDLSGHASPGGPRTDIRRPTTSRRISAEHHLMLPRYGWPSGSRLPRPAMLLLPAAAWSMVS